MIWIQSYFVALVQLSRIYFVYMFSHHHDFLSTVVVLAVCSTDLILVNFIFFLKMAFEFYVLDSCNFIDWIALNRRVLLSWRFAAFNTLKKVMKYFLLKIMSHKLWRMKFTVPMSSGHFKIRHIIGLVLYSLENISRTVVYSCIIGIEFLYVITSCKLSHEYHDIGRSKFSFWV